MECDLEETEATRNRKVEKSADEMFKELGYEITEEVDKETDKYGCGIQFKKVDNIGEKYIEFYYYHKQICIYKDNHFTDDVIRSSSNWLDVQELQAINKKCKELGWI